MKKVFAIVVCCAIIWLTALPAMAVSFPDLAGPHWDWARPTVEELVEQNIIRGYTDGTYRPNNSVTNEEAFTLFARTAGVNVPANEKAVLAAMSRYADIAGRYNTFASKELCYMLYRGLFDEAELDTYFSDDRKGQPLLRHEAAVLITKVLGGEQEVLNKYLYVLDFTDADQIPQSSKGYVEYVKDLGIMQGMDDGSFSPMTNVTRAQVAIMLKKTIDVMNLNYITGIVTAVDADGMSISIDGVSYPVGDGVKFHLNGLDSQLSGISAGMNVVAITCRGNLWAVDAYSTAEEIVEGIYSSSFTDTRGTILKVYDPKVGTSSTKEYLTAPDVVYMRSGVAVGLADLKQGDAVTLTLVDGKVTYVAAEPRDSAITGAVVDEIITDPAPSIRIRHSNAAYNNLILPIDDQVYVRKNNKLSDLRSLVPGDKVDLKLEYGVVIEIIATSATKTAEGSIVEITIGQSSSIKLNIDGTVQQFAVIRDTRITLDGKEATIYDLRLGYNVRVTIESETVTSIEVQSVSAPTSFTGTVELVNVSYGFINLKVVDPNGNTSIKQVFVRSSASIIDSVSATRRTLTDIKVGDTVMVTGAENMGVFEATTVIILK